tara:strand:- start:151 stop:471 length:321 start_codon:yes stop_codon:yes gene_type:complete
LETQQQRHHARNKKRGEKDSARQIRSQNKKILRFQDIRLFPLEINMPITNKEARNIKDIVNSYLPEDEAKCMFEELVEEIADTTDNDSVKQSILMLNSLYSPRGNG